MDLRGLAATIKARWVCEQAHQQVKEELGSTTSREGLGTASSSRADDNDCLRKSGAGKKNQRVRASTHVTSYPPRHRRSHHSIKPSTVPVLLNLDRHAK